MNDQHTRIVLQTLTLLFAIIIIFLSIPALAQSVYGLQSYSIEQLSSLFNSVGILFILFVLLCTIILKAALFTKTTATTIFIVTFGVFPFTLGFLASMSEVAVIIILSVFGVIYFGIKWWNHHYHRREQDKAVSDQKAVI